METTTLVLPDPAALRRYWCAVDGCSYEPRHFHGDSPLCCGHYGEYSGSTCDCDELVVDTEDIEP